MAHGEIGTGVGEVRPFDVKLQWVIGASKQQWGFSLRKGTALAATPLDIANHVRDTLLAPFLFMLPSTATFTGIDVTDVLDKTGAGVSPENAVGGSAIAMGPSFLAARVNTRSELRAKWGQGGFYLPLYFEANWDGDTINAQGRALANAVLDPLISTYVGTPLTRAFVMINWHKLLPANRPNKKNQPMPLVPASYYDVVSVRMNPLVTSLRSRKQGVGS